MSNITNKTAQSWRTGAVKALERQSAALVGIEPLAA